MKLPTEFDRGQIERLDQETLIRLLLTVQEQVQQLSLPMATNGNGDYSHDGGSSSADPLQLAS